MARPVKFFVSSLAVVVLLIVLAMGGIVVVMQTNFGHEKVRSMLVSTLKERVNGSVHIGRVSQGFLNGVTVDTLAIRGPDDSLFLSTGRVTLKYSLRDIWSRNLQIRASSVHHPYVHLKQYEHGDWNFKKIFRKDAKKNITKTQENMVDHILIESTKINDGTFILTLPWRPQAWAKGAVRDSIINYELARDDIDIRRDGEYFTRTWKWEKASGTLVRARLANPDSAERIFEVSDFTAYEHDPPFAFSNIEATVKQLGDSIWIDARRFELPNSSGKGSGKIVWGSGLPIRYDITVNSDSLALQDFTWIHPSLPETGGGRAKLQIRNNPSNLHLMQYIISDMDVRSERSHLLGAMTFELGADTLAVRNVNLDLMPVNFDLLRRLNRGPFPLDWQGDLTGKIKASGGNLARFKVEMADLTFADANVPGAVASGRADGMLNIFDPAFTEFKGLNLELSTLDLRTLQYVNKDFAVLKGTVSGRAVLDSSWLDVRFSNAELFHHYKEMETSRVTGNGRITWGEQYFRYEVALDADSLALGTIRESYPLIPLKGKYAGPITVSGELPNLDLNIELVGKDGAFTYSGSTDMALPLLGYKGSGVFNGFNLKGVVGGEKFPTSSLNGNYTVDAVGDTILNMFGKVNVDINRSKLGSADVAPSIARIRLSNGYAVFDTLALNSDNATISAVGSVAMLYGLDGKLNYSASAQSLAKVLKDFNRTSPDVDGAVNVVGTVSGALDSVDVDGRITVDKGKFAGYSASVADVDFSIDNVLHRPSGYATASSGVVNSVENGSEVFSNMVASLQIFGKNKGSFRIKVARSNRVTAEGIGDVDLLDSSTAITFTSAELMVDSANTYLLSAPTAVVISNNRITVDSLMLGRRTGGSIALRNFHFAEDSLSGALRTAPLDLAVLELLLPSIRATKGTIEAAIDLHGTPKDPKAVGAIRIDKGSVFVPGTGVSYEKVKSYISFDGDTVRISELTAETDRDRKGMLSVVGTIALDSGMSDPSFSIQAVATNLRAIDKRGLATLDISTEQPIRLTGSLSRAVVRGGFSVVRGTIYIPDVVKKRVVDLNDPELADLIDTSGSNIEQQALSERSSFIRNLRLENVDVVIGDEVWLRSSEANIKLGGSLTVLHGSAIGDTKEPFTLQGELQAVRGTYRLNVVPLIQPTFEVESGTIRFYGSNSLEPTLNITAVNTVRKPQQSVTQQDIRIRANIGGTLATPSLTLSSADNLPLTQSDLLSYLITGEPAFALDYTTRTYVNQLTAVVIRSAGNVLTSAIPRSVFDVVEIQTPGAQDENQARIDNPTLYNLLNTRAIFGKQLKKNVFLNLSTGLCAENFANNLGFRLEYRLNARYRFLFGLEPGSSELTCSRSVAGGSRSVQQTPPQFGLDLFKTWRF